MNLVISDESVDGGLISSDDESEGEKQLETGGSAQVAGGDNVINSMILDNEDENGIFLINFLSLSISNIDR